MDSMIEAESEGAHSAMMLGLMLLITFGCGIGMLIAGLITWLSRDTFCAGIRWPEGW